MISSLRKKIYQVRKRLRLRLIRLFKIDGFKLINHPSFSLKILKQLDSSKYESQERELVKKYIEPNDRVIELGGGMGVISMIISKIVPPGNIHVFEANPLMCKIISRNYKINKINGISVYNKVLGRGGGVSRQFGLNHSFTGSSLVSKNPVNFIMVEQYDFDSFIINHQTNTIVMDIEGGEYELISEEYNLPRVVNKILIELHPDRNIKEVELIPILRNQGFVVLEKNEDIYFLKRS